jgi:transcriptional regulator with XRE-family HTH domain
VIGARLREDFAGELDELRRQRGVSWEALAQAAGVSRTYLRDLAAARHGQGIPSEAVVERIARALDVEPDHFRLTRARAVIAEPKVIDAVYAKLRARRGKAAA